MDNIGNTDHIELPDFIEKQAKDAPLPVRYEHVKAEIGLLADIDECREWSDKAAALASYARQSEDKALETMAMRVRARATRRCGELLKEMPEQRGKRTDLEPGGCAPTRSQAAEQAGLSHDQHVQAVRLANVPASAFEEAVERDDPLTVTELAEMGKAHQKVIDIVNSKDPREGAGALSINSSMEDLSKHIKVLSPREHIRGSFPFQYADIRRRAEHLSRWLAELLQQPELQR